MYIFSYFKTGEEKLFVATSENGLDWEDMNNGEPLFSSTVGTKTMRDPFIIQDHEGIFHLLWTNGWNSQSIGYARSDNLVDWSDERLLPVMENVSLTKNCWAPEAYFDVDEQLYRLIWSSTVGEKERDHRIWSVTTSDFIHYSEPELFFDPGYNVIDATVITTDEQKHYMFFKDERGLNDPGTEFKAIRSCPFSTRNGKTDFHKISDLLTSELTEGPTVFSVRSNVDHEKWIMFVDPFRKAGYEILESTDLTHWTDISSSVQLPAVPRHGSVISVKTVKGEM